jgi:chromate transporter
MRIIRMFILGREFKCMLWELFWTFFKIGFISFGGGFAMIPVIEHEVLAHGWMSQIQYSGAVALAGMAPGSIATNSAIYVGYDTAGVAGAIFSAVGIILPSVILIVLISTLFHKSMGHRWVKSSFYILKPVIAGLIFYAAVRLAWANPLLHQATSQAVLTVLIALGAFVALARYKMAPIAVIILSGLVGIAVYS